MPLRARMLIVTVALFVAGLGVADVATYHFLSSFLVDRIDDQLRAATEPAEARLTRARPLHPGEHGLSLPDGSYAAVVDERGRVLREVRFNSGQDAGPRPEIPTALIRSQAPGAEPTLATPRAVSGQTEYRLIAKPLGGERAVVVAMPLAEVRATQHRLLLIEGLVSGLVAAAIGLVAYWLTRRELRPLERMGELVEEMLLLAQLDQGLPLERRPVELAAVVDAAVDAARAADPERPIEFEPHSPLVVLGSESRLRQVVDNLLTNARVHTPAATPIHVRFAAEEERVVLEVADEGPGVPAEEAERIFERFHRTDRSRARSQGGVGLGLAIVRSVVEAHGGAVRYRPRPGGGSIFGVSLPPAPGARSARARAETARTKQPHRH